MSGKKKIKIVKKEQRNQQESSVQKAAGPREAAREMVQNVTNWVNEFQQKRRVETTDAFKSLVLKRPRPSEA
jgi:hypothetical protein